MCLLIYLEKTIDTVMPWTRVCGAYLFKKDTDMMDQSVSPNLFRKDRHYDIMDQSVSPFVVHIYLEKTLIRWTRVCLLIYLEKTKDIVMP